MTLADVRRSSCSGDFAAFCGICLLRTRLDEAKSWAGEAAMKSSTPTGWIGFLVSTILLASSGVGFERAQAAHREDAVEEENGGSDAPRERQGAVAANATRLLLQGQRTFRTNTFGDESFWSGLLGLSRTIAGAAQGGVGPGLSPAQALDLGLKVDATALPRHLLQQLNRGQINLNDPATTLALLRLDAVVGVRAFFTNGTVPAVGITCALCHSTVNDSVAPGIGERLDGWANRDLNVGAIVAFSATLQPLAELLGVSESTVREVLLSWGPGKFDAELVLDGKAFRPDGKSAATLIPPAFGLAGVNAHTWTGWGSVTHWNGFVANLEMHGQGIFWDPRLSDAGQFPIAARAGFANIRHQPDLVTSNLAALHFYQLAIPAPKPPATSFDAEAARRGELLFNSSARCATCHVPPLFTEPGWNLHLPAEIGIDSFQADRSPDRRYRTAPLKGLWSHQKGGFYHDGRFQGLMDVVNHYDSFLALGLSDAQKAELVEFLKSL
jgi:hypothetical protein